MESAHVVALQAKHTSVERNLQQELARPHPDESLIQALKRQKLRIKDEIAHP